ncbi:hypothetical protein Tco_1399601 [Tanacetum coccineum]
MLNLILDTGLDSILNLNTESTSLVDVPVTTHDEIPPSSATTLPPSPIPLIQPLQQTLVSTPTSVPSTSLQNLPTFGSLFKFEDRVKSLEDDFSEFKQTNLFAKAVSLILGIVDKYLANQMNEAVKAAVQLQSDRLRIKKSVNEQLEAEVLIHSSNKAKTSHVVAANLSELELKKILMDKIENNKSIDISVQQKTIYKALVDDYETDKDILATYGDTVTFKRRRDDEDEDEEPSARSNRGQKEGKLEKNLSLLVLQRTRRPTKPPTPDRDWNKTLPAVHGPIQPWISTLARKEDPRKSFNELLDTPLDFSAFVLNRLKVDTLTPELLADPTFELMKGSCKSLVELEYFLEEVYKATTDQLDWNNPDGQQYPHDMRKTLPLIPNSRGRRVIPFDHFINNDLAYLSGGISSRTYATSVTKTKAADYGRIKWIEDLVPNTMWSQVPIVYDKHALWGISQWGRKC